MTDQLSVTKESINFRKKIKELQQQNRNLLKKNIEISGILDAIDFSSPTFRISLNRKISSINKIFLFLSGLEENEIVGQNHNKCFFNEDEEEYNIFWEMLLLGETIQKEELFEIGKIKLYLSVIYRPIFNIRGEISYISCLGTDLTESKQLENEIKEQISIIKDKNLYINQSLRYAETIQRSMLLGVEQLKEEFQTELIYHPKDIVSGDFYWAAETSEKKKVVGAIDCTGHGVPGAFLSFIGSKSLDEIVNGKQEYRPKNILDSLNTNIKGILNQKQSNNRDGMDVSLVSYEEIEDGKFRLLFSGAKLPLYYYKKKEKTVNYIKGSRKTIGGEYFDELEFEEHELILEKGDVLYLTTDGYIDQYSKSFKRFGKKRFQEMINMIVEYPVKKQKEIMEKLFSKFLSGESQRDDVTILIIEL